jgi:glycosyltransferase involved in cell wall biosynthesis
MVGSVAQIVARRFRAPLVIISQDVFPEIAVALGRLRNPLMIVPLRLLTRHYIARADRVVAIGETMKRRLISKGAPPARITVIPNWIDTSAIEPRPRDNEWARHHGLIGRFVVMHSGNVGHAQDLETVGRPVVAAAERETETAETVMTAQCGRALAPGDDAALAATIRELASSNDLDQMGRRAREYAVENLDRRIAMARYRALVAEVLADGH